MPSRISNSRRACRARAARASGLEAAGQRVDAHAAVHGVDADVASLPSPGSLRPRRAAGRAGSRRPGGACWTGGCRPRRGRGRWRVPACASTGGGAPVGDAVGQGADDAVVIEQRRGGPAGRWPLRAEPFEPAGQAGGRQEDRRLDERQPNLGLGDGRLAPQQAGQALGLAVGQDQRVVVGAGAAVGGPGPAVRIAASGRPGGS